MMLLSPRSFMFAPRLRREGPGLRTLRLTVDELQTRFRQHTITAALQCAGNKRDAFNSVKEVKGLAWDVGAIGNATWTGVLLRDVLLAAGMQEADLRGVQHIQFEGADADMEGHAYGASIPVHKVCRMVIYRWSHIVGQISLVNVDVKATSSLQPVGTGPSWRRPARTDHERRAHPSRPRRSSAVRIVCARRCGLACWSTDRHRRVIVPGVTGARNVKWLTKVVASDEESHSFWQRRDYKMFSPATDWDTVDWDNAPSIQDMPVNSAICVPETNTTVDTYTTEMLGALGLFHVLLAVPSPCAPQSRGMHGAEQATAFREWT